MIRVNLAPNFKAAGAATGGTSFGFNLNTNVEGGTEDDIKKQAFIRMFFISLPIIAMYAFEYVTIPELRAQVRSKTAYLTELRDTNSKAKSAVDEIEKFKKDKDRLQLQIDTLEGLASERLKEVKVLDAIQRDIPDRVWLTKLSLTGDNMILQGYSTADIETTNFMDSLSKSVHLKDVRLIKAFEQTTEGSVFKVFEIGLLMDRTKVRPSGGAM